MLTVLDIECTYQGKWNSDSSDPTPYNPANKLVSVGYKTSTGEEDYLIFYHKENDKRKSLDNVKKLQKILDESKVIIGHNLKFDMSWLFEAGFKYDGRYYDTMIFEYVNARGLKIDLSLAGTCTRYGLNKKTDILQKYCGEQELNVNEVPLQELIEYGKNDINITWELYLYQKALINVEPLIKSMTPAMRLMNDFLEVLIDVERNGIKIDIEALDAVEKDFKEQHRILEAKLKTLLLEVMGHTPINLSSPEQVSWVLYSLKIKDKKQWKEIFNLGTEERNGVTKKRYVKRYDYKDFKQLLRENTEPLKKTEASQCPECKGKGYIRLSKKDGSPRKRDNVCHNCLRTGIVYKQLHNESAGFGLEPPGSEWASDGGFSSDKETLDLLIENGAKGKAKEFLEALKEYNAISTYLSSFVEGIRKNVRENNLLHTNFNQCITSTGRLSSTRPNLQNQPREQTFPIRKVFISRFISGELLNADFKQLEFRVAAFLAQCLNAIKDILEGIDVHQQTSDALTDAGEPTNRQDSKKYTFRPLFGGNSGTKAQQDYIAYFFKKYFGIFEWHNKLCEEAVSQKYIQSPSGRVYAFPHCTRRRNGSVSYHTQIKNYEVQGFATGDILPVAMFEMYLIMKRLIKEQGLKSILVLTVHDSIVADVPPEEKEIMIKVFEEGFNRVIPALKERFGVDFNIPLDFDLDSGYNMLEKRKIKHG